MWQTHVNMIYCHLSPFLIFIPLHSTLEFCFLLHLGSPCVIWVFVFILVLVFVLLFPPQLVVVGTKTGEWAKKNNDTLNQLYPGNLKWWIGESMNIHWIWYIKWRNIYALLLHPWQCYRCANIWKLTFQFGVLVLFSRHKRINMQDPVLRGPGAESNLNQVNPNPPGTRRHRHPSPSAKCPHAWRKPA